MSSSSLAVPSTSFGYPLYSRSARRVPLYGVTLHTTGTGLLDQDPTKTSAGTLAAALKYYSTTGGPHYVIAWDGTIAQIMADDDMRGAHAGIQAADQADYYNGNWQNRVSPAGLALWQSLWNPNNVTAPQDLLPNGDLNYVNDYYLGIEMIPITYDGQNYFEALPAYDGAHFSQAQEDSAKKLVDDIASRYNFPSGWKTTPGMLIGHSDINPVERDAPGAPLWDPGYATGKFDMDYVRQTAGSSSLLLILAGLAGLGLAWWATRTHKGHTGSLFA